MLYSSAESSTRHFLIDSELFYDDEIRKKRSENKDCDQIVVQCGLFFS
jgi:hypothetical protein